MARARTSEAKDLRRSELMDAALEEFYERGFAAARMDDIARRAGLSKGTLYLYFDNKEALFSSLVEAHALPRAERLEAISQSSGGGFAAISAMMNLAPTILRHTAIPKLVKILVANAAQFPASVTVYRTQIVERILRAVARALEAGRDKGEMNIDDPVMTARLVVAPVLFSLVWRITFEHDPEAKLDLEALFAQHEKILRRALSPVPEVAL